MQRSYDVRVTALALDVQHKWLDNLLSQHRIPGVEGGRQGVGRRVSDRGLLAIAVIRALSRDGGLPVSRAVRLVTLAPDPVPDEDVIIGIAPGVELRVRLAELERRMRDRLAEAIEAAPRVPRGRPPRRPEKKTPDA